MGTVRILYGASTISLQAAVHPKYTLGALNMKEEEGKIPNMRIFKATWDNLKVKYFTIICNIYNIYRVKC